jgi:hypothetical protein
LPARESSGDQEQTRSDFRPKKLALLMAFVFVSLGCVLLSKTLDKVYLDAGFNVNMALVLFSSLEPSLWAGCFARCMFSGLRRDIDYECDCET